MENVLSEADEKLAHQNRLMREESSATVCGFIDISWRSPLNADGSFCQQWLLSRAMFENNIWTSPFLSAGNFQDRSVRALISLATCGGRYIQAFYGAVRCGKGQVVLSLTIAV